MEFEIDDDPQGLPDFPEGDRDGGVKESLSVRRGPTRRAPPQFDEEMQPSQIGEFA